MTHLLLAIAFNTLIGLVFRYFKEWNIDAFPAIVVNYWVCVIIGFGLHGNALFDQGIHQSSWMSYAFIVGIIFIVGFNIIAATVRFFGMTFTTIMQKISLVITAVYGIWVFDESSTIEKWTGIILAAIAVVLLNWKQEKGTPLPSGIHLPWYVWLLPFFTLLINASLDSIFLSMEALEIYQSTDLRLITYFFGIAAVLGSIMLLLRYFRNEAVIGMRELKAGLLLGLVNYGSIYFVLSSLTKGWEGSVFYTILNVSILSLTAILGMVLFSEKLSKVKWLGFILTIIAIFLIT